MRPTSVLAAVSCAGAVVAASPAMAKAPTGVKTQKPPYLVPTAPGVVVDKILSTSDIVPEGQTPPYPSA